MKGDRHDPFVGEEADASAAELGMARAADDLGTTILIVDVAQKWNVLGFGLHLEAANTISTSLGYGTTTKFQVHLRSPFRYLPISFAQRTGAD